MLPKQFTTTFFFLHNFLWFLQYKMPFNDLSSIAESSAKRLQDTDSSNHLGIYTHIKMCLKVLYKNP